MWLSYNDEYEVSDEGQVRSKKSGRILKFGLSGHPTNPNYYTVCLCKDGVKTKGKVHQMIANRFIPRIVRDGDTVDHIDRNPFNNNASNLRWASVGLQQRNTGIRKPNALGHKYINVQAGRFRVQIQKNGQTLIHKSYDTLLEAIAARNLITNADDYKS